MSTLGDEVGDSVPSRPLTEVISSVHLYMSIGSACFCALKLIKNLTLGVLAGQLLMEQSPWNKSGHDVLSQTNLPATHSLCSCDNRTHEAHGLYDESVCLKTCLN